jgi:hypothetical protein
VDEYASLSGKPLSPAVTSAIVSWLQHTLGAPAR